MAYRYRGRGRFTAPTTRSGKAFVYEGRRVTINGDNFQLNWNGPVVLQAVTQALLDAITNIADDALDYMRSKVPVDSGDLQASCYVNIDVDSGGRLVINIGASEYYAIYVELGTMYMGAQPYIRPTLDYIKQILPFVLQQEVQRRGRNAG